MRKFLLALAVLSLAGCTNLPTVGPVQLGGPLDSPDEAQVQYLASGPVAGANQQEILEGFLAAGAAAQDNYRVARLFLTDNFAADWNPLQESVIRGGSSSTSATGTVSRTFSTSVTARVTRGGFYTLEDPGASQSFDFEFEEVNGEWRIAQAPDAVFVTAATFDTVYQPFAVYFLNESRTQFVPDVRYFPRAGDPATEVARAVIGGPSEYLPHAVTAFPDTTSLVSSPVDISDGRALVDVSREVVDASADDQRAMLAQMTTSLKAITGISSVSLTVDRTVIPISGAASPTIIAEPLVNDNPLILRDGTLGFAVGDSVDALGPIGDLILELKPTSVSYHDTGVAAVGTDSGVYLVGDSAVRVSRAPAAVAPQIDGRSSVWWVANTTASTIRVFDSGRSTEFPGPWGSKGTVRALEVSRDDARVAVAVETASGPRLYVASVGRDSKGRVKSISGFHRLPVQGSSILDIAWADSINIAAITKTVSVYSVELASVGGVTSSLGQPTKPASIVGGNGRAELTIRSSDGQLWQPRAGGWQSIGLSAELLATQH